MTWQAVDVFKEVNLLLGRRLHTLNPENIELMFFLVNPDIWQVNSILHIYKNFINDWIDYIT